MPNSINHIALKKDPNEVIANPK